MSLTGYSLNYNSVPLDIVHNNVIAKEHLYSEDGTTYLYTRWIFDGIFVYNPQAVSFASDGGQSFGVLPTPTDVNIRELLRVQRAPLIYSVGGNVLLQVPPTDSNFVMDARFGPIVERADIVKTMGIKTFYINFRVIVYVNECQGYKTGKGGPRLFKDASGNFLPSPLLSHRWTRTETVDQDYFSTVVTEGSCVFRSDVLSIMNSEPGNPSVWFAFPDQFRRDLMHPIAPMFKRERIDVTPGDDGVTYSYRVTDVQKPFRGPQNKNCTRIEAYHTAWFSRGAGLAGNTIGLAGGVIAGAANLSPGEVAGAFGGALRNVTPSYSQHVLVRAWGNSNCTRLQLQRAAVAVCIGCLTALDRINMAVEFFISHEISGKFVQVELTHRTGLEQMAESIFAGQLQVLKASGNAVSQFLNGIFNGLGIQGNPIPPPFDSVAEVGMQVLGPQGVDYVQSVFVNTDLAAESVPGITAQNTQPERVIIGELDTTSTLGIPSPPNSKGSRGTWLGNLVANALAGPCNTPYAPPTITVNGIPSLNQPTNVVTDRELY